MNVLSDETLSWTEWTKVKGFSLTHSHEMQTTADFVVEWPINKQLFEVLQCTSLMRAVEPF